jgi:serine/threonine-protein kinase
VAVERFLREARTASSFTHGNIVAVTDLGRLQDGRPFLVMPKVEGTDLADLLELAGSQPPKRVADLLSGVASALDLVHAKGLVHRDIKPENLMYVVREDGSETVMLLDFGIAALVMSNQPRLTNQGAIFGTPHYLPPEVYDGRLPDARGDVYALATVAFELMTGVLPFNSDNPFQILPQKLARDAPTLERASGIGFPPEIEKVIARGLARNPGERYGSASALIGELRTATQRLPVSWRPGVLRAEPEGGASAGAERWLRTPAASGSVPSGSLSAEGEFSPGFDDSLTGRTMLRSDAPVIPRRSRARWIYSGMGMVLAASALAWVMRDREPPLPIAHPRPVETTPAPKEVAPQPSAEPTPAPTAEVAPSIVATAPIAEPAPPAVPAVPKHPVPGPSSRTQPVKPSPHSASAPAQPAPLSIKPSPEARPSAPLPPPAAEPPSAPVRDTALATQLTHEGTANLLGGRVARAVELLRRATQVDPSHAAAWRGLALALERDGEKKEAIAAYRQALRIEPQGAQADKVRERIKALE